MSDVGQREPAPSRSRRGYVLTSGILIVMMLGGTLPVPLYVLYEPKVGFGPLGVTMVFAAYVASVLVILLAFGDLSDHIGRRKVLVIAILFAAASTVVFLVATNIGDLILARVLSGAGAGLATGTATAALSELEPRGDLRRAAILAAGSNQLGLGFGPLIAGVFAEYVAAPTRTVFWLYLAMTAVALVAVGAIPETVTAPARAFRIRLHVGVPPNLRVMMFGAMLGVFAAFALLGLFSSLVPTFLHGILGVHNLAVIGAASFLIFATAGVSQAVFAGLSSRAAVGFGLPMLLVGLGARRGVALRRGDRALRRRDGRGRRRSGTGVPRRAERDQPAGRAGAPRRGDLLVLRRRLPRSRDTGGPHRVRLAGHQHGGRQRLYLRAGRGGDRARRRVHGSHLRSDHDCRPGDERRERLASRSGR